ncbi:MAG TPA: Gmad2 immunoglobulin-like domain-containing protein [Candidatus Paceibacterota bacterium]|nr:Gmad2 immunoglobulin-like domain-containing protein [Candidatus Paceibacterota bacterium]
MSPRTAKILIVILAIVIIVLAWFLFTTPASAPTIPPAQNATSTSQTGQSAVPASSTAPLDQSVVVTSPLPNATVGHAFTVAGEAPNQWFFEAVFPIKVQDADDNVIGAAQGRAQGDWTVAGPVTFTAQVTVDPSYHGPATLILLKDNPSGLPQNDDSVTIPIVIQ